MVRHESDLVKGVVAGIVGGLFASFMMEQFQALWAATAKALQEEKRSKRKAESKPATVKVADAISQRITGRNVLKKRQELAGEAVHYAMGGTSAAVYGALAEITLLVTFGEGLAFGAGVWLLADEVTVPALGLSASPQQTPWSTHAYGLTSHLVYGCVTEAVRRAVRNLL